jgi:hypothetical protein
VVALDTLAKQQCCPISVIVFVLLNDVMMAFQVVEKWPIWALPAAAAAQNYNVATILTTGCLVGKECVWLANLEMGQEDGAVMTTTRVVKKDFIGIINSVLVL